MKLACPQAHFPHQISIAAVAQWIEYWPPKPRVVGSIPASRTILDLPKPLILTNIETGAGPADCQLDHLAIPKEVLQHQALHEAITPVR